MNPKHARSPVPSAQALAAALCDCRERDAALRDDSALVAYEAKWQRKLLKLQRVFPGRWRVPGLSDEEVRGVLTLRLLEALRRAEPAELGLASPGREWGLLIAVRELKALRQSFRLKVVVADLGEAALPARTLGQEEAWLELEAAQGRARAQARAEQGLSLPQRRWLGAFKASAEDGAFFESSAEPNLSAPSRALGKHRSSALRAYRELQARFCAELTRGE